MDQIDQAQEIINESIKVAVANATAAPQEIPNIGACHNCREPLDSGLFCDEDCRDDWEKLRRNIRL